MKYVDSEIVRNLLEKSQFCFWENEEWGPGKGHIDWGPNYEDEMNTFIRLFLLDVMNTLSVELSKVGEENVRQAMKNTLQHYGIKNVEKPKL